MHLVFPAFNCSNSCVRDGLNSFLPGFAPEVVAR